jgi:hypothetical protein
MSSWGLGSGGASGYSQNGNTNENERVWGTDPWGNNAIVWETRASGDGNADGGWNADGFGIDNTKLYRTSVWVKRTSSTGGGTFYLGTNGGGQCVLRLSDGGEECNPYWHCGGAGGLTQNQWYLVVGHCFPYTYNSSAGHPDTGFWTVENGGQKVGGINGCNIGNDCKSGPSTTSLNHRTYHYYCGDSTTRLQFYDPRVDLVDGTEPKIRELLKGPAGATRNPAGPYALGELVNGIQWSPSRGGSFVFDGTNDYIQLTSHASKVVPAGSQVTVEIVNYGDEIRSSSVIAGSHNGSDQSFNIHLPWSDGNIYWDCGHPFNRNYKYAGNEVLGWHHWVFTKNVSTGIMNIYRDGVLWSTNSGQTSAIPTYTSMVIGAYTNNGSSTNYYHKGTVPVLNTYNRELTAAEIAENYKNYAKRYPHNITIGTQNYPASSASDIKTANPDAQDGIYWFTIGGSTFQAPVMFHAGKGMICVMKGGGGNGFLPDNALWENSSTQNTSDFDLNSNVASKYASYHTVPLSEFYFKLGATNYPVTFRLATAASSMLVAQQRSWNDSGNRSTPHYGMNQDYRTVQGADAGITATMGTEIYMYGMDLKHEGHYGGGAGNSGGRIRAGSILDESTGNTGALSYGTAGSAFGIGVNGGNPLKTAVVGYAGWSESSVYASTTQWSLWVVS